MFKLPIELNAIAPGECWTFNKTCILETFDAGRVWLATRMNVFADELYNVWFGDDRGYVLDDFESSFWTIESEEILDIPPGQIVEHIKNLLKMNYYVILDGLLHDASTEVLVPYIHESLIYGFDDEEKAFYTPVFQESKGRQEAAKLLYSRLEAQYEAVHAFYLDNPESRFFRSNNFFYPITKIRIKDAVTYPDKEVLIYQCLKKINKEYRYDRYRFINYHDEKEYSVFTGLGCLTGLIEVIDKILKKEFDEKRVNLKASLFTLYYHKINMIRTLNLLDLLTEHIIARTTDALKIYERMAKNIKTCHYVILKWEVNKKNELLSRISYMLKENRVREREVLQQAYETVHQYLIAAYSKPADTNHEVIV